MSDVSYDTYIDYVHRQPSRYSYPWLVCSCRETTVPVGDKFCHILYIPVNECINYIIHLRKQYKTNFAGGINSRWWWLMVVFVLIVGGGGWGGRCLSVELRNERRQQRDNLNQPTSHRTGLTTLRIIYVLYSRYVNVCNNQS